jgi:mRNA interferase RelE/StbE
VLLQADRDFAHLPDALIQRVVSAFDRLTNDLWPEGCQKVADVSDTYRLRIGHCFVIYELGGAVPTVYVFRVRHRREVYRRR